jgi:excisionase family DNA binding protein
MQITDYFLTISQTAKLLNVTRQTISRWVKVGQLNSQHIGREVLISKREIECLFKERIKRAEEAYAELCSKLNK